MTAKIESRLAKAPRQDLGEIAPIRVPFVLIVDPASTCNLKCRFCPTGDADLIKSTGRFQGAMTFEMFTDLIDSLEDFEAPIKTLRLYKEGEPLMNKRFADMVAYARQSKNVLRIDTTTNGGLLSRTRSEQIIAAGIDQINISVNGMSDRQFLDLVRSRVKFDDYVQNIKYLYEIRGNCEIYIKAIYENFSEDDRKAFLDTFSPISDRIFFEHLYHVWPEFKPDFLEQDFSVAQYGGKPRERLVCPYIFYSVVVNSDGSVSLCVQDWGRKLVIGSLREQTIKEIWLGNALKEHRLAHLGGCRKDNATCADCGPMSFGVHDDLDRAAMVIKDRVLQDIYQD